MIVAVPYVEGRLRPEVMTELLREVPRGVAVVPFPLADAELGYGRTMRSLWLQLGGRESMMVVEQDVVVPPGAVAAMQECPQPWCAHSYGVYWGDVAEQDRKSVV